MNQVSTEERDESKATNGMSLRQAQIYAIAITQWILPYCERIQIAGSIRRERPVCNDVDLVVIPKFEERPIDMFQMGRFNLLREFLARQVFEGKAAWLAREPRRVAGVAIEAGRTGAEPRLDAINYLMILRKCQMDIFCASAETWATLLLCRTGSKEHNIWFAQRAKDRGGHWNPYRGLELNGRQVVALDESDLYGAVGLEYIEPERRER